MKEQGDPQSDPSSLPDAAVLNPCRMCYVFLNRSDPSRIGHLQPNSQSEVGRPRPMSYWTSTQRRLHASCVSDGPPWGLHSDFLWISIGSPLDLILNGPAGLGRQRRSELHVTKGMPQGIASELQKKSRLPCSCPQGEGSERATPSLNDLASAATLLGLCWIYLGPLLGVYLPSTGPLVDPDPDWAATGRPGRLMTRSSMALGPPLPNVIGGIT
jgi:hypothetical protein